MGGMISSEWSFVDKLDVWYNSIIVNPYVQNSNNTPLIKTLCMKPTWLHFGRRPERLMFRPSAEVPFSLIVRRKFRPKTAYVWLTEDLAAMLK
jgi:hypothetical protein